MSRLPTFPDYGPYPQTVEEALTDAWTGLRVRFWSCRMVCSREATVLFQDLAAQGRAGSPLAVVFDNATCDRCGHRPDAAALAHRFDPPRLIQWHERSVHFMDGCAVSPGQAVGADIRYGAERLLPDSQVATVEGLAGEAGWVWITCNRCMHMRPYRASVLVQRFGRDTSSNVIRRTMRCSRCKWKRAGILHPSWAGKGNGWAGFPEDWVSDDDA